MTEEEKIDAKDRVERFLADPAVQAAFEQVQKDLFEQWKKADTVEKREALHAQARASEEMSRALRVVIETGKRAQIESGRRGRSTPRLTI